MKITDDSQTETVKEEKSERTDKRNKKKNKKRKINSEENVDLAESEIGSDSRKTKKLKSDIREENSDFSPQKKAKKNKKKKQRIIGKYLRNMSRLFGKPTMWFPNRSDTNRPVHAQKRARSLKFWI